jgi:hypothetical protein
MKPEIVKKNSLVIHLLVAASSLLPLPLIAQQINRTVLPVPEPQPPTITELDARNAEPYAFSADEGADVGVDNETMVSNDYNPGENKFTGKIEKVTIDTKPSNLSAADEKTVETAEDIAATIED